MTDRMNAVTTNKDTKIFFCIDFKFRAEGMSNRLFGLGGLSLAPDLHLHRWCSIRSAIVVCVSVFLVGCGGEASTTTTTTSNEDIAAFIQENPEFGNSPATTLEPSDSSELSLER